MIFFLWGTLPKAMTKFLIVICICGIFATITVLLGTHSVLCCIYAVSVSP